VNTKYPDMHGNAIQLYYKSHLVKKNVIQH